MKIEMTILGLLMEGNLYGYEVKKKIIERLEDYVDIKFGSIYYALRKAVDSGWVRQTGVEKEGGNPERYVYEILPEGRKYYKRMVRKYFDARPICFSVDMLIMFMMSIPSEMRQAVIEERSEELESRTRALTERISACADENEELLNRYLLLHVKAEKEWLDMVQLAHDRSMLRAAE